MLKKGNNVKIMVGNSLCKRCSSMKMEIDGNIFGVRINIHLAKPTSTSLANNLFILPIDVFGPHLVNRNIKYFTRYC
jgi:hypothetical protein